MNKTAAGLALASLVMAASVATAGESHKHKRPAAAPAPPGPEEAFYRKECGSCHVAYPPGFLPAASWGKVLAGLKDHFGENASLDDASIAQLSAYLSANAAENNGRRGQRVLQSLKGETPLRITEVPAWNRLHHEVKKTTWERPAVGGKARCDACHGKDAEAWTFDEDRVKIPKA